MHSILTQPGNSHFLHERRDDGLDTALLMVARNNHVEALEWLLERGANPNQEDHDGWTPLKFAVHQCNARAVESLLAKGAAASHKAHTGVTASMLLEEMSECDCQGAMLRLVQGALRTERLQSALLDRDVATVLEVLKYENTLPGLSSPDGWNVLSLLAHSGSEEGTKLALKVLHTACCYPSLLHALNAFSHNPNPNPCFDPSPLALPSVPSFVLLFVYLLCDACALLCGP
jgi:ankyrin repeat protein